MYRWTKKKITNKIGSIEKKIAKMLDHIIEYHKTPHEIALGFSIGVFLGLVPMAGIEYLIALLIIFLFKHINKLFLFAGMAVFNPIISAPFVYYGHRLGGLILRPVFPPDTPYGYIVELLHTSARILAGSIIIGCTMAVISYFIVKHFAKKFIHSRTIHKP